MNITLSELQVLLDATMQSCKIASELWNYARLTRTEVVNSLLKRMESVKLSIEEDNSQEKICAKCGEEINGPIVVFKDKEGNVDEMLHVSCMGV